jgi:16S rRNA (cytosine967-C5)-methyltransferase
MKNAERMAVNNITAICHDSTVTIENYVDKFDACLCDVPCSGFGVITDNPDIKLNREEKSIEELNKIQQKILNSSSKYVKNGGYLYYSTCSVFKQENQGIIDEFLSKNDDFIRLEIHSNLPNLKIKKGIQFLPHLSGGGFFIAKLQRK